jgi:hypothetical protein
MLIQNASGCARVLWDPGRKRATHAVADRFAQFPTIERKTMENNLANAKQALPPEQVAAKAAILAACDHLAEAGITFVAAHFDGSGDEGVNEDIKCYATEDYACEQSEVQDVHFAHLQEHFETLVPYGYEDNCGGFGDVILNVRTRTITVERNDRFEDYTTSSYEV